MLLPVNSQLQATITLHSTPEFKQYTGIGGAEAQLSSMLLPITSQLQATSTQSCEGVLTIDYYNLK
jgi:hypothetical protein